MFIKWLDIVRLRNVCLISIVIAKSFNLIPMSKKSTEFFQSVRIFPIVFVRIFEEVIWEHCLVHTCRQNRELLSVEKILRLFIDTLQVWTRYKKF